MGRMSKRKGGNGEREVAKLLQSYGYEARRGVQFGQGGSDNPDVVHNIKNVHIEVKRCERLSLYPAMAQANGDAASNQIPTIFHRKNNEGWLVVLKAEDFLKIMRTMDGNNEGNELHRPTS